MRRFIAIWPWVIAALPALVLLAIMLPLRVAVPHLDEWGYVAQYQDWTLGKCTWSDFFERHYVHPSAVGKLIYFTVMHGLHGNLGVLPLLTWGLSAVTAVCVCQLSRPLWSGERAAGAMLMFCATLTIFSPSPGEAWVWNFLFQNIIPGVCLAAGLVVLSSGRINPWRIGAASLLSLTAIFSFGSGLLVGVLLAPVIWHGMSGRSTAQKCVVVGTWLALMAVAAWIALVATAGPDPTESIFEILAEPWMACQFVLILLGQMLAKGTVFEPQMLATVLGGVLMIIFMASMACVFYRRKDRAFMEKALPWIVCSLFGLASAVLICMGRMHHSLLSALRERYAALTYFFVFGTVLLAATVLRHDKRISVPSRFLGRMARSLLLLFIAVSFINWAWGHQAMMSKSKYMGQERALLSFYRVLPLDPEWLEERGGRKSSVKLTKFLADSGRLPSVKFVPDRRMASFPRDAAISKRWARFNKPLPMDNHQWKLTGTGGLSESNAADLILITAEAANQDEQIIAVTAPLIPDNFFQRREDRRAYPEHYFGWSKTVSAETWPGGAVTLRAYVFEPDGQRVRPIEGTHILETDFK